MGGKKENMRITETKEIKETKENNGNREYKKSW